MYCSAFIGVTGNMSFIEIGRRGFEVNDGRLPNTHVVMNLPMVIVTSIWNDCEEEKPSRNAMHSELRRSFRTMQGVRFIVEPES